MSGYYDQARVRAQRRKSPWNFLLIPLVLGGLALVYVGLFLVVAFFQQASAPEGAYLFSSSSKGEGLMHLPLLVASVAPGMMLGNCVAWCIPPARRTFEGEAEGHSGTSFASAMADLFKGGGVILLVCLPISLLGSRLGLSYVTDEGVGIGSTVYDWSEIESVEFWCCGEGRGTPP